MTILNETARLVKDKLASEYEAITVERVMIGVFFSGVKLSDGIAGLSYTPVKDVPQAVCCPSSAGRIFDPFKINGMPAAEVLTALTSNEPIKAAVAIATLNALSAVCWERGLTDDYRIQMDSDAVDAVRMPADRSVAVIGAFVPVLRKLKARGGRWWVIEQDPKTLKGDEINHFIPADQAEEIIKSQSIISVAECICRKEHEMMGQGCNHPKEVCMAFGKPLRIPISEKDWTKSSLVIYVKTIRSYFRHYKEAK